MARSLSWPTAASVGRAPWCRGLPLELGVSITLGEGDRGSSAWGSDDIPHSIGEGGLQGWWKRLGTWMINVNINKMANGYISWYCMGIAIINSSFIHRQFGTKGLVHLGSFPSSYPGSNTVVVVQWKTNCNAIVVLLWCDCGKYVVALLSYYPSLYPSF